MANAVRLHVGEHILARKTTVIMSSLVMARCGLVWSGLVFDLASSRLVSASLGFS